MASSLSTKPAPPGLPALGKSRRIFWVHQASFTYRSDEPANLLQTLWVSRPGWGYLRRRDLWVRKECSAAELEAQGYQEMKPPSDEEVFVCPHCELYVISVPGYLVKKHLSECGGDGRDLVSFENSLLDQKRVKDYEQQLRMQKIQEEEERRAEERRERFERIKEENVARQLAKDRKKALKERTREEFRKR